MRSLYPSYFSLRQWSAVYLPRSLLLAGNNQFAISQKHGSIRVYADQPGARRIPTLELVSLEKIFNDPVRADGRFLDPVLCANTKNAEKFVLQNGDGSTREITEGVRIKLVFADRVKDPKVTKYRFLTPGKRAPFESTIAQSRDVRLPADPDVRERQGEKKFRFGNSPRAGSYLVKISGQAKRFGGGRSTCLRTFATDSRGNERIASMPARLDLADDWQYFNVEGFVRTNDLTAIRSITIHFYPKDWNIVDAYGLKRDCCDAGFRDLKVTITPAYIPACNFDRRVIM
jgi:hypothetical protein